MSDVIESVQVVMKNYNAKKRKKMKSLIRESFVKSLFMTAIPYRDCLNRDGKSNKSDTLAQLLKGMRIEDTKRGNQCSTPLRGNPTSAVPIATNLTPITSGAAGREAEENTQTNRKMLFATLPKYKLESR